MLPSFSLSPRPGRTTPQSVPALPEPGPARSALPLPSWPRASTEAGSRPAGCPSSTPLNKGLSGACAAGPRAQLPSRGGTALSPHRPGLWLLLALVRGLRASGRAGGPGHPAQLAVTSEGPLAPCGEWGSQGGGSERRWALVSGDATCEICPVSDHFTSEDTWSLLPFRSST